MSDEKKYVEALIESESQLSNMQEKINCLRLDLYEFFPEHIERIASMFNSYGI